MRQKLPAKIKKKEGKKKHCKDTSWLRNRILRILNILRKATYSFFMCQWHLRKHSGVVLWHFVSVLGSIFETPILSHQRRIIFFLPALFYKFDGLTEIKGIRKWALLFLRTFGYKSGRFNYDTCRHLSVPVEVGQYKTTVLTVSIKRIRHE